MELIRLGFRATAWHEASAAAVTRVLEAHEIEVEPVTLAPEATDLDGIDLFATAWLPSLDAGLAAASGMRPLGLLYRPGLVWCIREATASSHAIGDLAARPGSDVERRIPFAGGEAMQAAATAALAAYGLEAAGYRLDQVGEDGLADWVEGDAAGPGRVVALCRPHPLLHEVGLRVLEDPLAALGVEQEARLLIRPEAAEALDSDVIDELEALTLGNRVVNAMAHAMTARGDRSAMSAEAAADAWQRGKLTPRA